MYGSYGYSIVPAALKYTTLQLQPLDARVISKCHYIWLRGLFVFFSS